tara:strand:- start:583 stop:1611 length:1029 start_codon:yes stop_codon:yes gene_type:complete
MQQIRNEDWFWSNFRDMYLQRLQVHGKDEVYINNARRVLDRFGMYCNLITRRLCEITDQDVELYLKLRKGDTWRGKPLSNVTLNNEIGFINTCLAKAGPKESRGPGRSNFGFIQNPPYCEFLPVNETDPQVISETQIQQFSEAAALARSPIVEGCTPAEFWRAALLLGLITGLRRRGLLLIQRPSDQNLIEKRELFLPAKYHKTRTSLRIPLGSVEVVNILAKLPSKENEPLLPWRNSRTGKPLSRQHFSNTMTRIQREAGIPEDQRVKTKNLRSTAATMIAEQIGDDVASKRMGHAPGSKTLLTNYKAKRVSDIDIRASEIMGELVLPHVTGHGLKIHVGA